MKDILKSENLIELHEKLNEFAKYHFNKGGQKAHGIINEFWNIKKTHPRVEQLGSDSYYEGYDEAFKHVLEILHNKFVQ